MGSRLDRLNDWQDLARKAQYNAKVLAERCQVSLRQLERFWKESFQETPQSWLNQCRFSEAQALLQEGCPVKEVAFRVGFKQSSHFCREFKRHTGCTPNEFGQVRQVIS